MKTLTIGEKLKNRMAELHMSATGLARRAGVKPTFLYDIISGKSTNPSAVKLAQVAEVLGVTLAYLLPGGGAEAATPPKDAQVAVYALEDEAEQAEPSYFRRAWVEHRLRADPAELRTLLLRGDNMAPTLLANDLLLVDISQKMPSPPGIFALFDGAGPVVKRLEYADPSSSALIRVTSDNPGYAGTELKSSELRILGRVVWFGREI